MATEWARVLPMAPGRVPRAWQIEAAEAVACGWRAGQRPLIEVATGAGKGDWLVAMIVWLAQVEAAAAAKAGRRARRCAIVVHRQDLVLDLAERLAAVALRRGLSVGVVMADRRDYGADVLVLSVDSMSEGAVQCLGPLRVLIIDEAHHAPSETYQTLLEQVRRVAAEGAPGLTFLLAGVTATGFRGDEIGLGSVFSHLVYTYGMKAAIADGVLVKPIFTNAAAVFSGPKEAVDDVEAPARLDYTAAYYVKHHAGKSTVVVCKSKKHAGSMKAAFSRAGVQAEVIHSGLPATERARLMADLKAGRLRVAVAIDLILEGFDAPIIECVYLCRSMKSAVQQVQLAGRALRLYPGKETAQIVDFVGVAAGDGWGMGTEADLRAGAGPGKAPVSAPTEVKVGAWVRLLAEAEYPAGEVIQTLQRGRLAVRWGLCDGWSRSGQTSEHRAAEVALVAPDADRLLAQVRLVRLPNGAQVQLLDGAVTAWPWVEVGGDWSTGGRAEVAGGRNLTTIALPLSSGRWALWQVDHHETGTSTARRVGEHAHRIEALRAGERLLVQAAIRPPDAAAGAEVRPSEAQVRILRGAGLAVPERAGAAALLARAVAARRAVDAARKAGAQQHVAEHREQRALLLPHVEALTGQRVGDGDPATPRRVGELAGAWSAWLRSTEGTAERGAAARALAAAGVSPALVAEVEGPGRPGGWDRARVMSEIRAAQAAVGAR